ncbi:dihydrodipicolinate synthase family protein [Microvirga rosea]|uniref:dihydrodipicolinate synthase family protein n=1 Tax=Microvirga rosea TaxID=2715425 RepID=UPI001D09F5EC|nr:dihydrodipicolinate synthase family protein [Microvirga rosea]MCB8822252.1 dihydrodipicolinate synthase family protein [Microvirga rosea]
MKLTSQETGVYAIAPTPFLANGQIDNESVDRMTDFYEETGCKGITALGIMGEAHKLEADEAHSVAARIIKRASIPVVIGVSAPGFAAMRRLAHFAMDQGAAGVMIAPAPNLRTDDQIVSYFRQAIEEIGSDIPWVLQDYPLTLNVIMTPSVIQKIVNENPSCVMLKHEDWPGLEKISSLRKSQADGSLRPFSILCGNGGLFLDMEMRRGADGAMTGYAFVDALVEIVSLFQAGKQVEAQDLYDAHLPFLRYEQQQGIGLAIRKYVMMRRGILSSDVQRRPGPALTAPARGDIEMLLGRLARADKRARLAPLDHAA